MSSIIEIMSQPLFHLTIGTAPQTSERDSALSASMQHDLRLVKAALLYADRVTLCSSLSSMVLVVAAATTLSPRQQIEFYEQALPLAATDDKTTQRVKDAIALYKQLKSQLWLTPEQELLFRNIHQFFADLWRTLRTEMMSLIESSGAEGLLHALNSGIFALQPLPLEQGTDATLQEFVSVVTNAVCSGETYPLFDEQTSGLVSASINEGLVKVPAVGVARAKHIGLAANVLERLPLFDAATVEEVLSIRRELDASLIQFRSAMMKFSEKVAGASWDDTFPLEAEEVFNRDVAPAMQVIEAEVAANRYLAELSSKFFGRTGTSLGGGVLTVALSSLTSLPAAVAAGLGLGTAATAAALEAYREWGKEHAAIQNRNQLFFYYKARSRMSTVVQQAQ